MTFWTYMLHCADRLFYVGHTDDLARRLGEHQAGAMRGFSAIRRPVHLIWSCEFPTREEARRVEAQLKGWSRLQKLALIRGDNEAISALAKGKKEGASTSSAKPEGGEMPGPHILYPHASAALSQPFYVESRGRVFGTRMKLRFRLSGPLAHLGIPPRTDPVRRDLLWQHTCFEVFVRDDDGGYLEYNLSPSTEWAAYRFAGYRHGMATLDIDAPSISVSRTEHALELTADLPLPAGFVPVRIGLSAVLEERSGATPYWAVAHPAGDAPDFHHLDCFAIEVGPAGAS